MQKLLKETNKVGSISSFFYVMFIFYIFVPILYDSLQFNQLNI